MLTYTKRRQPAKLERHPFFLTFKKLINIFGSIRSQLQRSGYSLWRAGFSLVVVSGPQSTWAQFPSGLWDLSSPNRDQTHIPCIGRQILNHWTTREVPSMRTFKKLSSNILSFLAWGYAYVKIHLDNTSVLCISLQTQYPSTKNEKKVTYYMIASI